MDRVWVVFLKGKFSPIPDTMITLHKTEKGALRRKKEFEDTKDGNEYFILKVFPSD